LVKYTVLKDKDFSKGTASYKDEADAKKFFNDLQKDDEVISAILRKKVGPDSSMNMMGGAAKHLGSEYDLDKYTHPAWLEARQGGKKYDELTDQEKNIRYFLSTPSFLSKKKGFTNKDGSDPYWQQEGLEEGKDAFSGYFSKASLGRQIMDAEEILDSGMQNGEPLDNETEMLVQQELDRLKKLYVDNHGYTGMMASANPNLKKEKVIKFLKRENTSLEELYNQVQEARYGFFSNEEGNTASDIMKDALDEYEAAVERAFQKLVNKTTTAISIDKSGGLDTEVRENLAYQFDKIQEKITTGDYLNATFYKVYEMK